MFEIVFSIFYEFIWKNIFINWYIFGIFIYILSNFKFCFSFFILKCLISWPFYFIFWHFTFWRMTNPFDTSAVFGRRPLVVKVKFAKILWIFSSLSIEYRLSISFKSESKLFVGIFIRLYIWKNLRNLAFFFIDRLKSCIQKYY